MNNFSNNTGSFNSKKHRQILIFSYIWAVLTHGVMLFNKLSFMDDIHGMFSTGATYTSGRWTLGLLTAFEEWLFGGHYSTPLFNGALSILLIALSAMLLSDIFEIESIYGIIALSGITVTFPSIAGTFGYMFTAPLYYAGFLLSVLSAYAFCKKSRKWYTFLAAALLLALSLGVYQSYLPMIMSILLLYMLNECIRGRFSSWKSYILSSLWYGFGCGAGLGLYLLISKISLSILGQTLTDYKGINTLGYVGALGYTQRAILAYKEFFNPNQTADFIRYNMYPSTIRVVYYIVLITLGILSLFALICAFRQSISRGIQTLILMLFYPLAVNFIFVLVNQWFIYALTTYAEIMVFVALIWAVEYLIFHSGCRISCKLRDSFYKMQERRRNNEAVKISLPEFCHSLICIFLIGSTIIISVFYCRLSNIIYLKAELMESEASSYYTTLISRIEGVEGYSDELPVCYLGSSKKADNNWADIKELAFIAYEPYGWDMTINDNSWTTYMKYYCGFEPVIIDENDKIAALSELEEVKNMNCYPKDNSIRIIDGVIVVKFSF